MNLKINKLWKKYSELFKLSLQLLRLLLEVCYLIFKYNLKNK